MKTSVRLHAQPAYGGSPIRLQTRSLGEKIASALETVALSIVCIAATALLIASLFYSAQIRPSQYHVLSRVDLVEVNEITNLAAFCLLFLVLRALGRISVKRTMLTALTYAVFGAMLVFGLVWTLSIKTPPTYDSLTMYNALLELRAGTDAFSTPGNVFRYYFICYPFQFGFLSYMELFLVVFGESLSIVAQRVANVLFLLSSYAAILLLKERLYPDERPNCLCILLLGACVQPLLFCAVPYATIPSFALSVWGIFFFCKYLKTRRKLPLIACALLEAAAVYLKPNAWIVLITLCIVLVLDAIRKKRPVSLLACLLIAGLAIPGPRLIQSAYEARTGVEFGNGYPLLSWMAMSAQEGDQTSGWYDHSYQIQMKEAYGEDMNGLRTQSLADVKEALARAASEPKWAWERLVEKFGSQWLEPTFMSIWAINGGGVEWLHENALVDFIYGETFNRAFCFLMRFYLIALYGGFVAAALCLLHRRTPEQIILPIILLGGILYHVLFEAQSRYTLSYLPLFCPLAAYGILTLGRGVTERIWKTKSTTEDQNDA